MQILLRQLRQRADGQVEYQDTELAVDELLLGSAPHCQLHWVGDGIAPQHASLRAAAGGVTLNCRRGCSVTVNGATTVARTAAIRPLGMPSLVGKKANNQAKATPTRAPTTLAGSRANAVFSTVDQYQSKRKLAKAEVTPTFGPKITQPTTVAMINNSNWIPTQRLGGGAACASSVMAF